jgi:hypothetical protein
MKKNLIMIKIYVTVIVGIFTNAWVFSLLWLWFIVPIFKIQALNYTQALGIITVLYFFNIKTFSLFQEKDLTDEEREEFRVKYVELSDDLEKKIFLLDYMSDYLAKKLILRPYLFLFFGWVLTFFL